MWEVPALRDAPALGSRMLVNGLEWEYLGQYRYPVASESATAVAARPEWRVVEAQQLSPYEELLSKSYVDAAGGEWRVASVDDTLLYESTDVDHLYDVPNSDPAVEGEITTMAWSDVSCPSINNKGQLAYGSENLRAYNGDDRSTQSSDFDYTERKRLPVAIYRRLDCNTDWNMKAADYACSGVLVGSDDVLTAAHCLTTNSGNGATKLGSCHFRVCSLGNLHTATVDGLSVPANCTTIAVVEAHNEWLNWRHSNFDIGYLRIAESYGDDLGVMGLTENPTLATERLVHHATYSAWKKNGATCVKNISDSGSLADTSLSNMHMIKEEGQLVFESYNGILSTGFDAISGHSGSPMWWCPDNDGSTSCDTGDAAKVLGVLHGWYDDPANNTGDRTQFVSVPARKEWIEGNL